MADKNIVVTIGGNHDGIIKSFNAAEAAAKKYAIANGVAAKDLDKEIAHIAKATKSFIKSAADGFKFYGRQLQSIGGEGKAMSDAMEKHLRANGMAGKSSAQDIIDHYRKINPAIAQVLENARAEWSKTQADIAASDAMDTQKKRIKEIGEELNRFYGVARQSGDKIGDALTGPIKLTKAEVTKLWKELQGMSGVDMTKVTRAIEDTKKAAKATEFDSMVAKLQLAGDAGRDLARIFGDQMKAATLETEGGLDSVVRKLSSMEPKFRNVVAEYNKGWAAAKTNAKEALGESLVMLDKVGDEGKAAAKKIVMEFKRAGKLSKGAMEQIFAPLEMADPKMRAATNAIRTHVNGVSKDSKKMMAEIGKSGAAHLGRVAIGYLGVQEAVQAVTEALKDQQRVMEEARQGHITMGEAQAQAYKNLTTMSAEQRKYLLDDFVLETAGKFNFSGEGVNSLVKAVGDARSSGGTFGQIKEAVSVSAQLNTLDQSNVDETAAALVQAMRATGINDARLLASQMMVGQETSQVIDSTKFFRNAPAAMISASRSAAPGMEKQSAIESMAVFSALSRAGGDVMGESSQTATIQLNAKVSEYFKSMEKSAALAKSMLVELTKEEAGLKGKGLSGKELAKEQKRLSKKRVDLEEQLKIASPGGKALKDPGSFMGRLKFIRDNKLFDAMIDEVGKFGEQRFREGMEELMTEGETLTDAYSALNKLKASGSSTKVFEETAKDFVDGFTDQMQVSVTNMATESSHAQQQLGDTLSAMQQQNRETVQTAIDNTRRFGMEFVQDMINMQNGQASLFGMNLPNIQSGTLGGTGTLSEAVSGVAVLRQRLGRSKRSYLGNDGQIDSTEQAKMDTVNDAVRLVIDRTLKSPGIAGKAVGSDVDDAIGRARGETVRRIQAYKKDGYNSAEKADIAFWKEILDVLKSIKTEQERNRLASEAIAAASEATAENTTPGTGTRQPGAAQEMANGAR